MATKDFIEFTPSTGSGNGTISVNANINFSESRNTSLNISGEGITKSININQESGMPFNAGDELVVCLANSFFNAEVITIDNSQAKPNVLVEIYQCISGCIVSSKHDMFGIYSKNQEILTTKFLPTPEIELTGKKYACYNAAKKGGWLSNLVNDPGEYVTTQAIFNSIFQGVPIVMGVNSCNIVVTFSTIYDSAICYCGYLYASSDTSTEPPLIYLGRTHASVITNPEVYFKRDGFLTDIIRRYSVGSFVNNTEYQMVKFSNYAKLIRLDEDAVDNVIPILQGGITAWNKGIQSQWESDPGYVWRSILGTKEFPFPLE